MELKDTLLKQFKDAKLKAEYDAEINLKFAFDKNPEFKRSYDKIRTLQLDYAKAKFSKLDTSAIANEIKTEKENLHKIANEKKIDLHSLKPQYKCSKCKDTGILNGTNCECFNSELSKKILELNGLNYNNLPDFDTITYDIIKDENQKKTYQKLCRIFKEYISKLKATDKKLFLLSGQVGVGKTYLIKATTHEAIKNGYFALYTTAFDLNNAFLKYHCAKLENKSAILNKYLSCDLLLIDDLGTENKLNNVTNEYLYLIINERLEAGKNTIITSNLDLDQLKDNYDERIFSRISNKQSCIQLNLTGHDLRNNLK